MKSICCTFIALLFLFGGGSFAQTPGYTIKQTGASFAEPPPGRDKDLVPIMSQMEKVETTVVVSFKDRLVVDAPTFGGDANISAVATLASGGSFDLGSADADSFRRISADRQKVAISFGVKRLPDQPIKSVRFNGTVKVAIAAGIKNKQIDFKPQMGGTQIEGGFGSATLSKVENNSLSFDGDESLKNLHTLKLTRADGIVVTAQRSSWSNMGSRYSSTWVFQGPVSAGRLEFQFYDKPDAINIPIDVSVMKPY